MKNVQGSDYTTRTRNYFNDVLFVQDKTIKEDVVRIMTVY